MNNIDITPYNQAFQEKSNEIKGGPVANDYRGCNDICCVVTFIVLMLTFFIIGIYSFATTNFYSDNANATASHEVSIDNEYMAGAIIGMFILSILIAIIFVLLLKNFPTCMVYGMIACIFVVLIAVIILGFVVKNYWLSILAVIILLVLAIFLFCCRDKIRMGIILLQVSAEFISQKPTVYVAPLYPFLMGFLFCMFWIASFAAILADRFDAATNNKDEVSKYDFFIFYYVFMFLFMSEFLYYVMTFFIATACANWYYGVQENYYTTSMFRMNRYHLGSLTFGAIVITILTILRRLVQEESSEQAGEGNMVIACCLCLVACCLKCIEDIVRVLNHNSIIVMAVTGDSYIDSAKSALSIIFDNLGLFFVADFISDLVVFFGILASTGIPIFIGILILSSEGVNSTEEELAFSAASILFLCLITGVLIISMIGEVLSCVFIFYCFDKKFRSLGIYIENTPAALQNLNSYESGIHSGSEQKMH